MSEVFDGTVEVQDGSGNTTVLMDGAGGTINLGGGGQDGEIHINDAAGVGRIFLNADGSIITRDAAATSIVTLTGDGQIYIRRMLGPDYFDVFRFLSPQASLALGGEGTSGSLALRNSEGEDAVVLDGREGDLTVRHDVDGTLRDVLTFEGATAALRVGSEDAAGDIVVRDSAGQDAFWVDGNRAAVFVGVEGNEGDVIVRDGEGRQVIHLGGDKAVVDVGTEGNEGDVRVFDADGDLRIHLDGASGNVNLLGADCAEDFTVRDAAAIEPGSVLVIDDTGALCESSSAYDRWCPAAAASVPGSCSTSSGDSWIDGRWR
jgi:hypothetical protein